jgi:predicted transcriptional regulator
MFKAEILENERRGKIYGFIKKNPGLHFRELQRRLKVPLASLEYHLDYMVRKKVLLREDEGHYTRYYVEQLDAEDKKILRSLRQRRLREIVLIILSEEKVKYCDLLDTLNIPSSTLSFYLKYLRDRNVIDMSKIGYENFYFIKERKRVTKVLTTYKSSFMDRLVDKTLGTWMETPFRKSGETKQGN